MKNTLRNLFYLFLPLVVGSVVGILTSSSIDYNTLNQPPLSPPGFLFPIAWSILYLLMGIAYYLFQNTIYKNKTKETILYYLQLLVNALWSIFFFVLKWRLFSIFWIFLLGILVLLLIILWNKRYKPSAYLFIPYFLWLIYALYLNIGVYLLN